MKYLLFFNKKKIIIYDFDNVRLNAGSITPSREKKANDGIANEDTSVHKGVGKKKAQTWLQEAVGFIEQTCVTGCRGYRRGKISFPLPVCSWVLLVLCFSGFWMFL